MTILDVYAYNVSCLFTTLKDRVLVIKLNFPNFIVPYTPQN